MYEKREEREPCFDSKHRINFHGDVQEEEEIEKRERVIEDREKRESDRELYRGL